MCRILRWTGYASALIGAILIIMAIIGGFRFHHHYVHAQVQDCCMMHHGGSMAVAKVDSTTTHQHSMMANSAIGKEDSVNCCKNQPKCYMAAHMSHNSHQMYKHRIGFHVGLAICFLFLAITLFMISNSCRCKRCREDREGKGEQIEDKKA